MAGKLATAKIDAGAPLREQNVNMSNSLIRAAHGLTLAEKRVVSACLAKMDSVRLDSGRYKFKVTAEEFASTYEVAEVTAYEQLMEAGKKLVRRVARAVVDTPRGKKEREWVWASGVTYHHGEGWVELGFSHEMTPHLAVLRKEFTSYKLKHASALRSIYSWRLLELMMQFKKTGLLRIDVEGFCHAMEVSESAKKNFGELRRTVIEPAVRELTEKDNLIINWQGTKQGGRKITGLEFRFEIDPQGKLEV